MYVIITNSWCAKRDGSRGALSTCTLQVREKGERLSVYKSTCACVWSHQKKLVCSPDVEFHVREAAKYERPVGVDRLDRSQLRRKTRSWDGYGRVRATRVCGHLRSAKQPRRGGGIKLCRLLAKKKLARTFHDTQDQDLRREQVQAIHSFLQPQERVRMLGCDVCVFFASRKANGERASDRIRGQRFHHRARRKAPREHRC